MFVSPGGNRNTSNQYLVKVLLMPYLSRVVRAEGYILDSG